MCFAFTHSIFTATLLPLFRTLGKRSSVARGEGFLDRHLAGGREAGEGVEGGCCVLRRSQRFAAVCLLTSRLLFGSLTWSCLLAGARGCLRASGEGRGLLGATAQLGATGPRAPKNTTAAERRLSTGSAKPAAHRPKEGPAHRGLQGAPRPLQPGNGPWKAGLDVGERSRVPPTPLSHYCCPARWRTWNA